MSKGAASRDLHQKSVSKSLRPESEAPEEIIDDFGGESKDNKQIASFSGKDMLQESSVQQL